MADRHTPYYMLLEAFARSGCPICAIVEQNILRYLDITIHEHVNDLDFREELRKAGGFCNAHAWWLVTKARGAALGSAIMYRDVLHTLRERMTSVAAGGGTVLGSTRKKRSIMPFTSTAPAGDPHVKCPACHLRSRDEDVFVGTLLEHCREWRFMEAYAASTGLCFIHLDQALLRSRNAEATRRLLEAHDAIVARLIAELDEFQRKNDYRYQGEPFGREATSWQRAIEMVNGKDGIR